MSEQQIARKVIASQVGRTATGPILNGVAREVPGSEPVRCAERPECAGCPYPKHGSACNFSGGKCLRTLTAAKKGGE